MAAKTTSLHVLAGHGIPARPSWARRIMTMLSVRRSRQDLAHLGDDQLRDIGLTPEDVAEEIARPIWDVPKNWRR